ncbi:MAG: isochorismatase family protein, partial [Nitrososphaeraceae archaeon]|nr:isochorismatase family protein [Nitrososphaeraceae archaeon]
GVEEIILTGIHTDICIKHTVYDAFLGGYDIIIPENGVCSSTLQKHRNGLDYMKNHYSIKIEKIEDIIVGLNKTKQK